MIFSENSTTKCTGSDCSAGDITPAIGAAIGLVLTLTGWYCSSDTSCDLCEEKKKEKGDCFEHVSYRHSSTKFSKCI